MSIATQQKNPPIHGTAYAGGRIKLGGWYYPVVIDLAGLEVPENVPLLANHENRTAMRVGQVAATIEANTLTIAGEITSTGETAKGIIEQAKAGADWQLSVGVEVEKAEEVLEESRTINGQNQEAPFVHVKAGRLREVSVVAVGADINTDLQIQASFNLSGTVAKELKMTTQNTIQNTTTDASIEAQAIAKERERVAAIQEVCAGQYSDIEAEAIREGWDVDQVAPKVLAALRDSRPQGDFNIHTRRSGENYRPGQAIEAWFLRRLGREDVAEAELGGRVCEAASRLDANSMLDICQLTLRANGIERPANRNEMIRAALSPGYAAASGGFSTVSLPSILSNVANKSLLHHMKESSPTWQTFCHVQDLRDFKESTAMRLNSPEQLEELGADSEIKHGTLAEENYHLKLDTFAKTLKLTRKMIINDDLGVFREIPVLFAKMANRKTSDLVYDVLLKAGGSHFASAKGNYMSGAASELMCVSLGNAVKLMRVQQENGNDLDLQPATLVVPPSLEAQARAVLESEYVEPETSGPSGNSMKNIAKLAVEPRLENSTKFSSYASSKALYLFASPADQPMIVGFPDGKMAPQIDFFDLMADPNVLAVQWRVYLDVGVGLGDPRAAVKATGE